MKIAFGLLAGVAMAFAGCGTNVSRSKQNQVALVTQTGQYSYLRGAGGASGR